MHYKSPNYSIPSNNSYNAMNPVIHPRTACPRAQILGIGIDALDLDAAVARVAGWIDAGQQSYGIFRDVHGLMLCRRNSRLREIHNAAGMVAPDGMPLVWLTRAQYGSTVSRVYGPDFMKHFCSVTAHKGYRHYLFGAAPGTPERLKERLCQHVPDLRVVGTLSPPFDSLSPEQDSKLVERINAAEPDVVWVGLSTPKQEFWMAEHLGRINAAALLGVGAAFDFISGNKPQAPGWLRHSGFEWAFRLATEPRRLLGRYARHLPVFLILVMSQTLRGKLTHQ